jgi:hypothetical protein
MTCIQKFPLLKRGEILHFKANQGLHRAVSHSMNFSFETRAIVHGPQGSKSPSQNLGVGMLTRKDLIQWDRYPPTLQSPSLGMAK